MSLARPTEPRRWPLSVAALLALLIALALLGRRAARVSDAEVPRAGASDATSEAAGARRPDAPDPPALSLAALRERSQRGAREGMVSLEQVMAEQAGQFVAHLQCPVRPATVREVRYVTPGVGGFDAVFDRTVTVIGGEAVFAVAAAAGEMHVYADGWLPSIVRWRGLSPNAREACDPIVFVAGEPTRVTGVLVDLDGRPVPFAQLSTCVDATRSDAHGSFAIGDFDGCPIVPSLIAPRNWTVYGEPGEIEEDGTLVFTPDYGVWGEQVFEIDVADGAYEVLLHPAPGASTAHRAQEPMGGEGLEADLERIVRGFPEPPPALRLQAP